MMPVPGEPLGKIVHVTSEMMKDGDDAVFMPFRNNSST
jgi:hypothetical protein